MRAIQAVLLTGILLVFMTSYVAAEDESVTILAFHSFDPTSGKQIIDTNFNWPEDPEARALVRFKTDGYDKRKTVELYFVVYDRNMDVAYEHSRSIQVHAGEHEYIFPYHLDISKFFEQTRFRARVEVKLVGANRASDEFEMVVNGPKIPDIEIKDLLLKDPETGATIVSIKPNQEYMLTGTVNVSGNTTNQLPKLVVWGLMTHDEIEVHTWEEMPFSDYYWDQAQFNKPNGKWRFEIEGRMPLRYLPSGVESQPFEFTVAVAFTSDAFTWEKLSGTVLISGSGTFLSDDLDDRLIFMERNWKWELVELN